MKMNGTLDESMLSKNPRLFTVRAFPMEESINRESFLPLSFSFREIWSSPVRVFCFEPDIKYSEWSTIFARVRVRIRALHFCALNKMIRNIWASD